jgi:beta-carotene 3-hydroxylase
VSTVTGVLVAALAFVAMEPITALVHRFVMHGIGLGLHRSHHRPVRPGESPRRWEANDAFPVMFAAIVMIGFAIGFNVAGLDVLVPIGVGVTVYGAAYALVHDVYIHGRLPLFAERTVPGLERLAAAHRIHHRHDGAPYGMLVPVVARRRHAPNGASSSPASGS